MEFLGMLAQRARVALGYTGKYSDLRENLGNFAKFGVDFREIVLVITSAVIRVLC